MNNFVILFLLTAAAALESGGDALARSGLHAASPGMKLLFLLLAALVLFVYGVTVNAALGFRQAAGRLCRTFLCRRAGHQLFRL